MFWLNTRFFPLDYCLWYMADTEWPEYQVFCHLLPAPSIFWHVFYVCVVCAYVAVHVEATGGAACYLTFCDSMSHRTRISLIGCVPGYWAPRASFTFQCWNYAGGERASTVTHRAVSPATILSLTHFLLIVQILTSFPFKLSTCYTLGICF